MSEEQYLDYPPKRRASMVPLAIALIVASLALLFWGLTSGKLALDGTPSLQPDNLEETLPGTWQTDDSPDRVRILFVEDGTYELTNVQGVIIPGDWSITEDELVEVPILYRNFDGVWHFEPIPSDRLQLQVPELDIDWIFYEAD